MKNEKRFSLNRAIKKNLAMLVTAQLSLAMIGCADISNAPDKESTTSSKAVSVSASSGISAAKLEQIKQVLQEDIDAGLRAGYAVMIAKDGKIIYKTTVGMADRENAIPVTDNTRFRIASMTKAITTTAIMQLVESGTILLSDPVAKYIPAYANARVATSHTANADGTFTTEALKRPITIHHLLTHTSGYDYSFFPVSDLAKTHFANNPHNQEGDLATRIERLAALPLYEQPGEKYRYGYGVDIAGRVIEIASGKSLEEYMKQAIFAPLGMTDTEFSLDKSDFDRLAVTYSTDKDGRLLPTEVDPFQPPSNNNAQGWMSGGGGLISTTSDYMHFLMMILNEGELNGVRILSPSSVKLMLQRNVSDEVMNPEKHPSADLARAPGVTFGLGGYVVENPGALGTIAAVGQWGWDGYYDTSTFISPTDELAVIIMAQHNPWAKPASRVKGLVTAITYGALEK